MLDAFLSNLNGTPTEEVAWVADLSYWITGALYRGAVGADINDERKYLEFHRDLGVMPYFYFPRFWVARSIWPAQARCEAHKVGHETTVLWETPVGTLRQVSHFSPDSLSEGITKYAVETPSDLDVLVWLLEHRAFEPDNLDDYAARRALWAGYDSLPCLGMPRQPMACFVTEWAGVMNTSTLVMECPDRVAEAVELMDRQERPIVEAVCEAAPPVVHFPDNLTSEVYTGLFDTWMADNYRWRVALLREAGVRTAVHLDGAVRGLLPRLTAVGIDSIEALTPAPVGDMAAEDMRERAGSERVTLWGGVPGAMFAAPWKWGDMAAHVDHVLEVWSGKPFVLGVADQVPPDGDLEFCRHIARRIAGRV